MGRMISLLKPPIFNQRIIRIRMKKILQQFSGTMKNRVMRMSLNSLKPIFTGQNLCGWSNNEKYKTLSKYSKHQRFRTKNPHSKHTPRQRQRKQQKTRNEKVINMLLLVNYTQLYNYDDIASAAYANQNNIVPLFNNNISNYSMESKNQYVRLEVCEKCYEHHSLDPHQESLFEEASSRFYQICCEIGLPLRKNIPYKCLRKLKDSKSSTKRYLDTNNSKVIEFPRRSAFEIYYMNILIYSKIKLTEFPDYELLKNIMVNLRRVHIETGLMEGFSFFRDTELQWKTPSPKVQCLYQFINKYTESDNTEKNVKMAFNKIFMNKSNLTKSNNKIVLPYTRYLNSERHQQMESIYCPNSKLKMTKNHNKISSKVKSYINFGKTQQNTTRNYNRTSNATIQQTQRSQFDMINMNYRNKQSLKKYEENLAKNQVRKFENQVKQIYWNYLGKIKGTQRPVKTAHNYRRFDHNRLASAMPTTRKKTIDNSEKTKKRLQSQRILNRQADKKTGSNLSKKKSEERKTEKVSSLLKDQTYSQNKQTLKSYRHSEKTDQIRSEINWKDSNEIASSDLPEPVNLEKQKSSISPETTENNFMEGSVLEPKTIREDYSGLNQIQKLWENEKNTDFPIFPAPVVSKFSQKHNFSIQKVYQIFQAPEVHKNVFYWPISGQQLTNTIQSKSLRQIFQPNHIKLFPNHLSQIEGYKTKLTQVVNTILQNNPRAITSIFQNNKYVHPFGIYCVWLRTLKGKYEPIFVNDEFAIYPKVNHEDSEQFVYANLSKQNSIWFMILEKAIARVVGGYENIQGTCLSVLLSVLLGFPTVDFSNLSVVKAPKIFQEKLFINKHSNFYARNYSNRNNQSQLQKIIDFRHNQEIPKDSTIVIQQNGKTEQFNLYRFLLNSGEVTLSFHNIFSYLNQKPLIGLCASDLKDSKQRYSCLISSSYQKNCCYWLFNFGNLAMKNACKVSLYRLLKTKQSQEKDNRNLYKSREYQYVGQIRKMGDFFFENSLEVGDYLIILQANFTHNQGKNDIPYFTILSEKPIYIKDPDFEIEQKEFIKEKSKIKKDESTLVSTKKGNTQNDSNRLFQQNNRKVKKFMIRKSFAEQRASSGSDKQNMMNINN